MSRATINEATEGDVMDVSTVTGTASSWTTVDSTVNQENVRDEAIDRRLVAARTITPANGRSIRTDATKYEHTDTAFALVGSNAKVGAVSIDTAAGEMLRIRASCYFRSPGDGTDPHPPKTVISFVLGYATAATSETGLTHADWTTLNHTFRQTKLNNTTPATSSEGRNAGSYTVTHYFSPASPVDTSNFYVGLFVKGVGYEDSTAGTKIAVDNIHLSCMKFVR